MLSLFCVPHGNCCLLEVLLPLRLCNICGCHFVIISFLNYITTVVIFRYHWYWHYLDFVVFLFIFLVAVGLCCELAFMLLPHYFSFYDLHLKYKTEKKITENLFGKI